MIDPTLAALRAALEGATSWVEVGEALRRADGGAALEAHRAAFMYMFVEQSNTDYRARYGPIAPMIESAQGIYPTPIEHLSPGATDSWAVAMAEVDAPLLQARYGDLLWLARHGARPHQFAVAALAAYEALAEEPVDGYMTSTHAAQRALELAMELNDRNAAKRIAASAVHRAAALLTAGAEQPGVPLRLLEAVAAIPVELRPADLVATVELAERTYEGDPWLGDSVADLLASLIRDDATRVEIRRRQVRRWQRTIDAANGIVRPVHIQHAIELATLHHLGELRANLLLQLQATRDEPVELQELAGEIKIPRDELERIVARMVGDDSATAALARLAAHCPSGDPARNRQLADELRQLHPIQFLVTGLILSEDNLPIRFLRTEQDHLDAQLRRQEIMGIRIFSAAVLVPALERIVARYGIPSDAVLVSLIAGGPIDDGVAPLVAAAAREVLQGDDDASAHRLAPRLERGLRELARLAGVLVVREPRGQEPGGVRQLASILADLEGVLPENWRRYFACLLTDPLGLNLRNRIAHGLVDAVSHEDAALLLHAAVAISQFRVRDRHVEP